jgi:hypothetical protein
MFLLSFLLAKNEPGKGGSLAVGKYGCAQIWNPVDLYPILNVKIDVRPEPLLPIGR